MTDTKTFQTIFNAATHRKWFEYSLKSQYLALLRECGNALPHALWHYSDEALPNR